jgi:hypothetical protein
MAAILMAVVAVHVLVKIQKKHDLEGLIFSFLSTPLPAPCPPSEAESKPYNIILDRSNFT